MNILVILKEILPLSLSENGESEYRLCDSDKNVLTEALHLRDETQGQVTVIAFGVPDGEDLVKEVWSYGVNKVIFAIDKRNFSAIKEDAVNVMYRAGEIVRIIRQIHSFDLIFFGRQAVDGDSIHMAAAVSHMLDIPLLPYSRKIRSDKPEHHSSSKSICAVCAGENAIYQLTSPLPAVVLSVKENLHPRFPRISDIRKAYGGMVQTKVIELNTQTPGNFQENDAAAPAFHLYNAYYPEVKNKEKTKMLEGKNEEEKAEKLLCLLKAQMNGGK